MRHECETANVMTALVWSVASTKNTGNVFVNVMESDAVFWWAVIFRSLPPPYQRRHQCVAQAHTTGRLSDLPQLTTTVSTSASVRRPGPHHRKTDPLEGFRQVHHSPKSSSPARHFEPLYVHQHFPDCPLSSSISPISGVPLSSIPLLPLDHLRSPQ